MSVFDVLTHTSVGFDANGTLCACGVHSGDFLEHLGDVVCASMGTTKPAAKTVVELRVLPPCNITDCDRPTKARGLCRTHYDLDRRQEDLMESRTAA